MSDREIEVGVGVSLGGNVEQKAKQFDESFKQFSQNGRRHMSLLDRSARKADRALLGMGNRFIALASGATVAAASKHVGDMSARLNQLGIDAGYNGQQLDSFKASVQRAVSDAAASWGVDGALILDGMEAIIQKTGDVDTAVGNIENLGKAIAATNGQGAGFGQIVAELQKIGITDAGDVLSVLDALVEQGQNGAFVLADLAKLGERAFAAYGPKNKQQVLEMGAALQTIRKAKGSSEEATTAFAALMNVLTSAEKVKPLHKAGIDIFDEAKLAAYRKGAGTLSSALLPINEVMANIAKHTGGDKFALSALIPDENARSALSALMSEFEQTGKTASIDALLNVSGDGTKILQDAKDNLSEVNAQLVRARELAQGFAFEKMAGAMERFADATGEIDVEKAREFLEVATDIATTGAKIAFAYKALRIGGDLASASKRYSKGSPGGTAGAINEAFSMANPRPVYVVNAGGLPGAEGGDGAGPAGKEKGKPGSRKRPGRLGRGAAAGGRLLGRASQVGSAAFIGYEIGSIINRQFVEGTALQDAIGEGIARGLAALGSENAAAAVQRMDDYDDKKELVIKVKGAKVVDAPDNVVDASAMGDY
jgi:hypothetical protein